MLVLSRRTQERIVIDGNITITILEVRGNTVKIGIEAPRNVAVHRAEIERLIHAPPVSGESSPAPQRTAQTSAA